MICLELTQMKILLQYDWKVLDITEIKTTKANQIGKTSMYPLNDNKLIIQCLICLGQNLEKDPWNCSKFLLKTVDKQK